ncbi:MAG: PqqD family protein [bacterium]
MEQPTVKLESVYVPSEDIVAREIEGELIIVPLAAGVGDMEDELYSLNDTGQDIWRRLDGTANLAAVVSALSGEYRAEPAEITRDVVGLVGELLKRGILVEKPAG